MYIELLLVLRKQYCSLLYVCSCLQTLSFSVITAKCSTHYSFIAIFMCLHLNLSMGTTYTHMFNVKHQTCKCCLVSRIANPCSYKQQQCWSALRIKYPAESASAYHLGTMSIAIFFGGLQSTQVTVKYQENESIIDGNM